MNGRVDLPIVSVIVPVYNTSEFLEECISSLTNQSLYDIEIVCVDDCSKDDSVSILKKMRQKDDRIIIIEHKTNQGLLKTRGDGVKGSTGKYILFLDSDDTLKLDACEKLSAMMDKTNCDMIQFGTDIVPHGNVDSKMISHYIHYLKSTRITIRNDAIFYYQFSGMTNWHVWNKIYKAEICKKSYEMAGEKYLILSDDLYISFFNAYYSKKMMSIREKYYFYNIGRGYTRSDTSYVIRIQKICDNSWFIDNCIDFLIKNGEYERLKKYCFREPLLQMGPCVSLLKNTNDDDYDKGLKIINDTWNRDPFKELLSNMLYDKQWNSSLNKLKRHTKDFGILKTLRVFLHMIAFKICSKITQILN